MRIVTFVPLTALAVMMACDSAPVAVDDFGASEIVVTQGVAARSAPMQGPAIRPQYSKLEDALPNVGGSVTSPLSIAGEGCAASPAQVVTISYSVSGNQESAASFKVYEVWTYDAVTAAFTGSSAKTVNLPAKTGGGTAQHFVQINVVGTGAGSGATLFTVTPFDVVTSGNDGQRLNIEPSSSAKVYVAFTDCTPSNTAPSITAPADITEEATSGAGAVVAFTVPATDAEDGDLTDDVVCTPLSGSIFPLGATTVSCSVTDSGGLSATGGFTITVVDTNPPEIAGAPTGPVTLIAEDRNGATYDASGITANDLVDGAVAVTCGPLSFGIGLGDTVTCVATDSRDNEAKVSFYVVVTLDLSAVAFTPPLRMQAPFSAHKMGSTIPHKFPAPLYADGTPATDLADMLRLALVKGPDHASEGLVEANEFAAGSTAWRYDATENQYIFNLKTGTKTPWAAGTWYTSVSIGSAVLASTEFYLRK